MPPCFSISRIGIIDPHEVTRHGIRQLLSKQRSEICWEADSSRSAMDALKRKGAHAAIYEPAFDMTHAASFIETARGISPCLLVIIHTMMTDVSFLREAMGLGALALVSKAGSMQDLVKALDHAVNGQAYVSPEILNLMHGNQGSAQEIDVHRLTAREKEVFRLVGLGQKASQIATTLGISPRTVDAHKQHIKDKLQLDGNISLAATAGSWVGRSW